MVRKKVDITNMSIEELERYIEQLKEPLVVKPVKKKEGGAMKTPKVLPKPKPKTSTNKKLVPHAVLAMTKSICVKQQELI